MFGCCTALSQRIRHVRVTHYLDLFLRSLRLLRTADAFFTILYLALLSTAACLAAKSTSIYSALEIHAKPRGRFFATFLSTKTQGKHAEVDTSDQTVRYRQLQRLETQFRRHLFTFSRYLVPFRPVSASNLDCVLLLAHPVSGLGFCATIGLWQNRSCRKSWLRFGHLW